MDMCMNSLFGSKQPVLGLLASAALVASWSGPAGAQDDVRIGVVNVPVLMEQAPQAKVAMDALQEEFAPRQRDILARQQELEDLNTRVQRDLAVMGETERRNAEMELRDLQRDVQRLQTEFREDLNLRRKFRLNLVAIKRVSTALDGTSTVSSFNPVPLPDDSSPVRVFGDDIEDRLGKPLYLLFYLGTGIVATAGADEALWFVEIIAGQVGRITADGEIREFPLPDRVAKPHAIIADPAGGCWFTESAANRIGHVSADGTFRHYDLPSPASEPHGITVALDGTVWAALETGAAARLAS